MIRTRALVVAGLLVAISGLGALPASATSAPAITGVSPGSGPNAGGTVVTITGSGLTGANSAIFGGVYATGIHVVSDTQMTVVAPGRAIGTYDVRVHTSAGWSDRVTADQYTYAVQPITYPSSNDAVVGQTSITGTTTASRCSLSRERFATTGSGGPQGVAVAPSGRFFAADTDGGRVLSWPSIAAYKSCGYADIVIGAGQLVAPTSLAVAGDGTLYVSDTKNDVIDVYTPSGTTTYTLSAVLGTPGVAGTDYAHLAAPRGLALMETGLNTAERLVVADSGNNRVLFFDLPATTGEGASDASYAGGNGGFSGPSGVAIQGDQLFVADPGNQRVLRFTGPFDTPSQTYKADTTYAGLAPNDLAIAPDGTLWVADNGDGVVAPALNSYPGATQTYAGSAPSAVQSQDPNVTGTGRIMGLAFDRDGRLLISQPDALRLLVLTPSVLAGSSAPDDPRANPAAFALLHRLQFQGSRATGRTLIGQELKGWDTADSRNTGYFHDFYQLAQQNLPTPSIMSDELSFVMPGPGQQSNAAQQITDLENHAKAGGVVGLDWHPDSPIAGVPYQGPTGSPASLANFASIIKAGTAENNAFNAQLADAAQLLGQFQTAGIPVLLRPMVEQNLEFKYYGFWWGDDVSHGAAHLNRIYWYDRVFNYIQSYLESHGVHNVLYVYSANNVTSCCDTTMAYYPGAAHADVVGVDTYSVPLNLGDPSPAYETYREMIGSGKPFGMTEFGQTSGTQNWDARTVITAINRYPRMAFAVAWYSSPSINDWFGLSDVQDASGLLNDPLVSVLPAGTP